MVLLPSSFLPAGLAFATFAVLPLVAYTLLSANLKEFLQSEFEAWKADVQRVSSSNERTSPTREDTTLLDAATLARLKAEVAELRARILATRETQESAIEARCLGQMVCNAEFEAYWKTEKDDLQKALTAANSSLQAMKVECISKEAQILMLTQANQDLEAANEELDAVNEQRAKEGEDIQIANSLIISNHTNKIITLTTNLRATEAKCRSFHNEMSTLTTDLRTMETKCRANEVEVRALTQAKEDLRRTNESLEEQILGLADRVSEYRGRLTEALANPSTAATTFPPAVTHVAPPQYMESYRTTWQAQTQSADSSPWNFPAPNPDRYVRRYAMLGSTPSGYEKAPVLSAPNSLGIGPSTSRPLPVPPLTQLPILSPLVAPPRYADPYTPAWQGESETHRAGSSHWISSIPSPGQYSYLQVASTAPTEQYPKVPVVAAGYADAQSAGPPPHMDFGQPIFPPPFEMAASALRPPANVAPERPKQMILLPACPLNAFPDCTISVLAFFLLQIGGYALFFTRYSKRLDFEHSTWSTALLKISELQNHAKEGLGELARERDSHVLSLRAEMQELRGAISTLNKSKGEVEARMLEREVEFLEREARWAKERDDLRKASEFTISKYAVESIAALNARLHAVTIECESKDARVQSLAQAKGELEAARSKDLLEYMLLKQKEELEREHSHATSKLTTEITTLTAKLQATEMKCESKELQIRTIAQTKAGIEGENRQLEEKVLSLTDKLSEYRILLNEALSPIPPQYPTSFLPPPPPPEYSGFEWGHKQTQSAVPSPSMALGGVYGPCPNPDRYDRRHVRKVRIRDPAKDEMSVN